MRRELTSTQQHFFTRILNKRSILTAGIIGVLATATAGGWYWIHTNIRPTSTSALNADSDFLFGMITVTVFIAAGLSFWRSAVTALILRTVVAILAIAATLLTIRSAILAFPLTLRDDHSVGGGSPWLLFFGVALFAIYCSATFATALPLVPSRLVRRFGPVLHFGLLPSALLFFDVFSRRPEHWTRLYSLGIHLSLGLGFALLCMRMYDLRVEYTPNT